MDRAGERRHGGALVTRRREDGRTGHKCQGWTVFHLPSTPWSLSTVRSGAYGHDFNGLHFDLFVFLLPRPTDRGTVERAAAMALLDVAAPALSLPASGPRPPYRSRPVDVAEEVEQRRVLGARRVAACRSGQRADRGPRRRRTKLSLAGCSQRILAGALERAAMLARRSLTGGLKPAIGDDGVS